MAVDTGDGRVYGEAEHVERMDSQLEHPEFIDSPYGGHVLTN